MKVPFFCEFRILLQPFVQMFKRVVSVGKTAFTNGIEVILEASKIKILSFALGAAGFGGLSLLNGLFGLLGTLAGWGLTSSTADLLRKAENHEDKNRIVGECARFAIVMLGLAVPFSIAWLLVAKHTYADYLTDLEIVAIVAIMPVPVLMAFARGYLVGSGTTNQVLALRIITPLLVLVSVVGGYYAGLLGSPIIAFVLTTVPAGMVAFWLTSRILKPILSLPRLPSADVTHKLVALGAAFTASSFLQASGLLIVRSWMVSLSDAGMTQVGLYVAAVAICSLPIRVAQSYFGIYRARLMSSAASNPAALSAELFRSTWVIVLIGCFFSLVMFLLAGTAIRIFMTLEFMPAQIILEGISFTIPLKLATVPFVYQRFITGKYIEGLAIEFLGTAGLVWGVILFYDSSTPSSIVKAHWLGALLPLVALVSFHLFKKKPRT